MVLTCSYISNLSLLQPYCNLLFLNKLEAVFPLRWIQEGSRVCRLLPTELLPLGKETSWMRSSQSMAGSQGRSWFLVWAGPEPRSNYLVNLGPTRPEIPVWLTWVLELS